MNIRYLFGFLLSTFSLPAAELTRYEFVEPHMATLFRIVFYAPNPEIAKNASQAAFTKIEELNRAFSDYAPDSELNRFCRIPAGTPVPLSPDLFLILSRGQQFAEASHGSFDMTVGRLTQLWRVSRKSHRLPAPDVLAQARAAVGWKKLSLATELQTGTLAATGMQLDLGGIAKGFAADAALAVLRAHGCPAALVAASGDIALGDAPPGRAGWDISLGSQANAPHRTLAHCGVSTSGDFEQFAVIDGVHYAHILDPRTGLGLTQPAEVSVIAPDATTSDALATALCIVSAEEGKVLLEKYPGTSAVFKR